MPPSASASGSRHRPSATPYDRAIQPSQSTSISSGLTQQHKSKKRKASDDTSSPQMQPAPTLAATAMATFAPAGPSTSAGGRPGSGGSVMTDLSQASSQGIQGEGKKQRKKKRRAERALSTATSAAAEAGEGTGDVDMKTEEVKREEGISTGPPLQSNGAASALTDTLPFPIHESVHPTQDSASILDVKPSLDIKPSLGARTANLPSAKHKRKHGQNEAGESKILIKMRELRQTREDLAKSQARLAEEEKARKEQEAEMTGLQLQVAELEGRLKAQKEAMKAEAEAKEVQVNGSVETIEKLKEAVACGVCMDTLKDPHILSCGHIACKECLQTYFRTNNALVHRIQDYGEDLPADVDISYRTKMCHVCRSHILRRPTRMYHLSIFFDLLGLEAHFPSASQMQAEQAAIQAPTRSSTGSAPSRSRGDSGGAALFNKKDDPWSKTFPIDGTAYTLWDASDNVTRCPECHGEVDGGQCLGCDIEFSVDGESDWEGMGSGSGGDDSDASDGSDGSGEEDEGDGTNRAGRRVAFAARDGDRSEDEVERETAPNAQPMSSELAVQERMRQVAQQRAQHDQRAFNVVYMSPTTQRMARELVEAEAAGGTVVADDSSESGAGTQTSEDEAQPPPPRRSSSGSLRGDYSRNGSRHGSTSRSSYRNRGSTGQRGRRDLGSLIDDEASDDEDPDEADEEDEPQRHRSGRARGMDEDMDDADRLATMDFNAFRERASARRVGRSEHVGDEADSELEAEEEGANDYDLEDDFIDDGEVEEGSMSGSEESDSGSSGYETRRRKHKKLKKSKKTRSRNDEDDTDDNEAVMNSGNDNHGDNPDDYDSDAVQEVDHDAMRLARTKRFGLTSNTTSDAGASTNRGQVKQGVKARYELESSLEVEEPVAASASRNGGSRNVQMIESDSDVPIAQPKSRSSSQRSRRKNRVIDPDSDVDML